MELKAKQIGVCMVAAVLLSACGEKPPKTIQDIDSHILSVTETKDAGKTELRIVWKLAGVSPGPDMSNAAFGMERIFKNMVKYFPDQQVDEVRVVLNAGLVDRYGNTKRDDIYEIPFAMSEIRKINFSSDSLTHWGLLNLSERPTLRHPVGRQMISEFCEDEKNAKYAGDFCLKGLTPQIAL